MKKRIKKEEETVIAGIDILPMINVSLILVIILMITSPMLNQPNIEVTLPEATTSETREKNVTVTYSADRQLGVNTEAVSFEELVPAVLRELGGDKNKLVVIRGDA
ncbi:MAG: ExbD/TolR family protein, partial [Elusimicrobiota bacterium]